MNSYICPSCKEEQDDAAMTSDGYYLDADNCAADFSCPNCYGPLSWDQIELLDGDLSTQVRLFQVHFTYIHGKDESTTMVLYRGTYAQLEHEVRGTLDEQAVDDQSVGWSYDDQHITAREQPADDSPYLSAVDAREIVALEALTVQQLPTT